MIFLWALIYIEITMETEKSTLRNGSNVLTISFVALAIGVWLNVGLSGKLEPLTERQTALVFLAVGSVGIVSALYLAARRGNLIVAIVAIAIQGYFLQLAIRYFL
jgi:hypothetical protein